jgi:hypothetical protein
MAPQHASSFRMSCLHWRLHCVQSCKRTFVFILQVLSCLAFSHTNTGPRLLCHEIQRSCFCFCSYFIREQWWLKDSVSICWFHFNLLFHTVVEVAEKVFKAKMIMRRWLWTCAVILSWNPAFDSHEQGVKKNVFEEDHRASLIKLTADRYLTLRLCTYCKRFNNTVVTDRKPTLRHQLTKLILFKNQWNWVYI